MLFFLIDGAKLGAIILIRVCFSCNRERQSPSGFGATPSTQQLP